MCGFFKGARSYSRDTEGGVTLLGLYLFGGMVIVGGLALDVSNLISVRTELQSAADFAAHAALYERQFTDDPNVAKAKALQMVKDVYPIRRYGEMLKPGDIHFGTYDRTTQGFRVDENSKVAAVAFTGRNKANGNKVAGYLTAMIGYGSWNVATSSVFETYRPTCLRDGWVGQDVVDAQSNNQFATGFCIHSNTEVQFNSGSTFEAGVEVSAPGGFADIVVPASGYVSNVGLYDAIGPAYYNLRILNQMAEIFAHIQDPASEYDQPYLDPSLYVDPAILAKDPLYVPPPGPVQLSTLNSKTSDFQQGYINVATCSGNQQLFIDATPTLKNVAIRTNCKVTFRQGSSVENVVLFTTSVNDKSITAPNGLRMGANDHCAHGGGVKFMTYGGFQVAQDLQIYGSQVLARGPIQFAAAANGIEGGSFISGKTVDGTSNTAMGTCDNGGGDVFEVDLFRMAG